MAAVAILTLALLICKAQSQTYGLGPQFPGSRIGPEPYGPNIEINAPYIYESYGLGAQPNILSIPQPNINTILQPNLTPIPQLNIAQIPQQTLSCNPPVTPAQGYYQNQYSCINQPVINPLPSVSQPLYSNVLPQVAPSIITNQIPQSTPVVTTVVDNTLANSLANAIQLLIVSNLIGNTLGSGCGSSLLQTLGLDAPCINNYEVLSTSEIIPSLCEYQIDYSPCTNDVISYQEPVFRAPCAETPCNSNFGSGYGSSFSVVAEPNSVGFDSCGLNLNGPNPFGIETCTNVFGPQLSAVPSFGCAEPAVSIAPMAVEVPFPASIPAQLTCNFGYLPTNVPCVSVNVEPLPFAGCQNFFSNLGSVNY